ncbi:hypothetical protein [Bacillus sp. Marseille-Q3570]|uniref:hypothetical protein n=1 Tax=Bacillus sp. Marseille-Q3570 TaxID=2963522 RepID=UPI0021B831C3|nr:hypothetical protein [Bacillus sp. Marseille-Q3570]
MPLRQVLQPYATWFRYKYEIQQEKGEKVIVSTGSIEDWKYDPFSEEILPKRPQKGSEHDLSCPHVALARLDTSDENSILNFVNRFGLLGLWKFEKYCMAPGLPDIGFIPRFKEVELSKWFVQPNKIGNQKYREPLSIFIKAIEDFKEILSTIEEIEMGEVKSDDKEAILELELQEYLKGIRFNGMSIVKSEKRWVQSFAVNSLLSAIYFRIQLEKISGRGIRVCQKNRCGKFFISENPEAKYCSDKCKNAQLRHEHEQRRIKNVLLDEFNSYDLNIIENIINSLQEKGVTGEKRIMKQLKERLTKEDKLNGR